MTRNTKYIDRLYLAQGDDDTVYIDNDQIPQQTIEGIRFLYRQFKKRKNGVILNDPFSFSRNLQICLFVKAVRPLLHRPILILCQEGCEKDWIDRFDTWTTESLFNETAIETVQPFSDKMVMINTMVNLHLFCAREWSIIIVDGDQVTTPNPILKLPFKACFKIWNTAVDVKRNLDRFEEVYKWLYPRASFDKKSYIADSKNGSDVRKKSILMDTICQDIVLRREEGCSFQNFRRTCDKATQKCETSITAVGTTTSPPPYRMVGQTSIHPVRRIPNITTTTIAPSKENPNFLHNTRRYGDTTITPTRLAPTNSTPTALASINGDSTILQNSCLYGDTTITPTTVTPSISSVTFPPRSITPSPRSVTLSPRSVTPSPSSVTFSPRSETPPTPTISVNPSPISVTSPSSSVTPSSSRSVSPSTSYVTLSTSYVTPSTSSVTPSAGSVTTSTSCEPIRTITKKNKDSTGTKIKRSKVRIIDSDPANQSFSPSILLSTLLAESPLPEDKDAIFYKNMDYSVENFELLNNEQQQSMESSYTEIDENQINVDAVSQTLNNNLEELDVMVLNHDLVVSRVSDPGPHRHEPEPYTILTRIPGPGELDTHNKLLTDKSVGTMSSEKYLGCSYNTERDKKNDSEMLKIKSEVSTLKPKVGITKIVLDELNWEMSHLGTTDKDEQLGKRQKTSHSSETVTSFDDIIKRFSEQNKYTSVSYTKTKTEQIVNSLKRSNVDVLMKECEENVTKKFKGSFLDSLF